MTLLISGVLLWSVAHLFPVMMGSTRALLIARLGANAYRGLFALDIVIALVLIVLGWKSASPVGVYVPPLLGSPLPSLLILAGFILFVAAQRRTNIKRFIRHPQLTGLVLWGVAHLLTNGDSRSVVLFGGLTAWSIVMMLLINRRDGAWNKPEPVAMSSELVTLVVGAVAFGVLLYSHQFLFGVAAVHL